jgi:hypothetical protein
MLRTLSHCQSLFRPTWCHHEQLQSVMDLGHGTEGTLGSCKFTRCHFAVLHATSIVSGQGPFGILAQSLTWYQTVNRIDL